MLLLAGLQQGPYWQPQQQVLLDAARRRQGQLEPASPAEPCFHCSMTVTTINIRKQPPSVRTSISVATEAATSDQRLVVNLNQSLAMWARWPFNASQHDIHRLLVLAKTLDLHEVKIADFTSALAPQLLRQPQSYLCCLSSITSDACPAVHP